MKNEISSKPTTTALPKVTLIKADPKLVGFAPVTLKFNKA